MKISVVFLFETCPKIGDKDLRSFVKPDHLAFKPRFVFEARKTFYDQVDQSRGGAVGSVDAIDEAAIKILDLKRSLGTEFT